MLAAVAGFLWLYRLGAEPDTRPEGDKVFE